MKKIIVLLLILLIAALAYIFLPSLQRQGEMALNNDRESRPFQDDPGENNSTPPTLARCVFGASSTYRVPTDVVIGIMYVEGGHIGQAVGPNVNGTYDLGLMQVNSLWIPELAELWHVDYHTAYNSVRDSGCENIYVGAWILKQSIATAGTLYDGIAYYHSATRGLGAPYANKVVGTMKQKGLSWRP